MVSIDLTGRTALVTGATGKLGPAMVKRLAEAGADVIICYAKNNTKAEAIKAEVEKIYGVKALTAQVDITSLDSVKDMSKHIKDNFKMPDIIVNCANAGSEWKPVLDETIDNYIEHFNSSVIHNVAMIKTFVPHMIEQGYGRVIGINTECSLKCTEGESAYSSAKRAMDGVYRCLVKEISHKGITVNQIAPGWMMAEEERKNGNEDEKNGFYYTNRVPMKKRGTEMDIANAVLFLASDLAGFINGVYLPVCGGNVLPCI